MLTEENWCYQSHTNIIQIIYKHFSLPLPFCVRDQNNSNDIDKIYAIPTIPVEWWSLTLVSSSMIFRSTPQCSYLSQWGNTLVNMVRLSEFTDTINSRWTTANRIISMSVDIISLLLYGFDQHVFKSSDITSSDITNLTLSATHCCLCDVRAALWTAPLFLIIHCVIMEMASWSCCTIIG